MYIYIKGIFKAFMEKAYMCPTEEQVMFILWQTELENTIIFKIPWKEKSIKFKTY